MYYIFIATSSRFGVPNPGPLSDYDKGDPDLITHTCLNKLV